MWTTSRQSSAGYRGTRSAMKPTPGRMAIAFVVSWVAMLAHNLSELPLTPVDIENSGPLLVDLALLAAYWRRPTSRVVQVAILGWALLNLVIGGMVSVLPLPVLPFVPEQSWSHYVAHLVYTVGQVPLVLVAVAALRHPPHHPLDLKE